MVTDIRPSPIAGRWYESDPNNLSRQVDRYLNQAVLPELNGQVIGVIAPHAGHRYSGQTAGYAFRCLKGLTPELVVVVSPMHSATFRPILTTAHRAYQTPLGQIPVDQSRVARLDQVLRQAGLPGVVPVANDSEHSLEIELPFLQRILEKPFMLLPIMVHSLDFEVIKALGLSLAEVIRDSQAIMVASTDLSHFYPENLANALDREMLNQFAAFSPEGVIRADQNGEGFACGAGPVSAVFWAAKKLGANAVEVLHHSTSAEQTGDYSSVVGYGAAVLLKRANTL